MKTNCKKWKYLLGITTVVVAFTIPPVVYTYAVDAKAEAKDDESEVQETTSDKMDSVNTTAGAAVLLDADISLETEELIELAENNSIPDTVQEEASQKNAKEEAGAQGTLVMAKVNQSVNIRESADQESEKVGVLYKDCGGEIVEQQGDWTKIKSGDVVGWVKNEYLYFGEEAEQLAQEVGILTAYAQTETLRVRKEADAESGVLGLLANGEALEAISEEGDWVSVSYEGTTAYVSAEYVKIVFGIDTAESMESIRAREEAAKVQATSERQALINEQKAAVFATASELDILAALIQCEAGGEPYEGQVAVGAVVMNRVRCGGYPNTITEVIYQSGQFVPASKGKMESLILNNNINPSCRQAAQEAISGVTNVGDALHFRRAGNREGLIIGNHVFW
ncbi:MAG: cell wall hydrolase [Roseburia sp.]|nr:cell wall hydrolase [Roseburia sp.]